VYGTVARFRLKPGSEAELFARVREFEAARVPGFVGNYIYRMDADPHEYYLAVVFESKEAYVANANSPEQHARYVRLRELLETDPEWHDGEVVYARP
jgi:heme-degrading monooxygenase HmoA